MFPSHRAALWRHQAALAFGGRVLEHAFEAHCAYEGTLWISKTLPVIAHLSKYSGRVLRRKTMIGVSKKPLGSGPNSSSNCGD